MRYIFKGKRRFFIFILDILIVIGAYYAAIQLRFGSNSANGILSKTVHIVPILVVAKIGCFVFFGLYNRLWRYASINDLVNIFKGTLFGSVAAVVFAFMAQTKAYPRSIWIIDWLLSFLLVSGIRLAYRVFLESIPTTKRYGKRLLIVGACDSGEKILREIKNNEKTGFRVIGFVDAEKKNLGMQIHGVPVMGLFHDLKHVLTKKRIEEVVIAATDISGEQVKNIVAECKEKNVVCRTIPKMSDLIDGTTSIKKLRNIELEDLLGRETVKLDMEKIKSFIHERSILVTGAGGSIGAELCRQISRLHPSRMVVLDKAETPLHEITLMLQQSLPQSGLFPVLMDLRNKKYLASLFDRFKFDIIFHAAAYKHVPILEYFPEEAVTNNIVATKNLVDIAKKASVGAFILVSTDKVVNPTSVMGVSKRICEMYIQELNKDSNCKYITVRFGNVLESNGSVVPLFKRQIWEGGPVTVTHPDVERYFMSIPEAIQLIIQASALGTGGEIFVLDMGKPIKIIDLAKSLINLSGYQKDEIKIVFTGLRPGEKLAEALYMNEDKMLPTKHSKIKMFKTHCPLNNKELEVAISKLTRFAKEGNIREIIALFKEMVPEYQPSDIATKADVLPNTRPG